MSQELWSAVDAYITDTLLPPDATLEESLAACESAGLPAIQVSAAQGKFLHLLARIRGAANILEVGTLGGYSSIWLARALSRGGRLVTIEIDPKHAEVAAANFARARLTDRIELRVGNALEVLPEMAKSGYGPFDLSFIDADKPSVPIYFDWALKMSKPGSIIIVDNVVREGAVADASSQDASVLGVRRLNEIMAAESRVSATVLQTVGVKGYDGFSVALVNPD